MTDSGNERKATLQRAELLIGGRALDALAATRVILFGVGGVGSWAAEALVRSGIGHLTIVDPDEVCITNVNRQLQATPASVGRIKVNALRERLLTINPQADVCAVAKAFTAVSREEFELDAYEYVLDAIDTIDCKLELISAACAADTTLFSSMGAAWRLDTTSVRVTSIWRTRRCPLARLVRQGLRSRHVGSDFLCVYSEEPARGAHESASRPQAVRANGSMVHVTGAFGFALAGLVVQDVIPSGTQSARSP